MGCVFCATGQGGYGRNLNVEEIVHQVAAAQQGSSAQLRTNVVFMGMGEPLANYDAVLDAIGVLNEDLGVRRRKVTISTVGVVPGIRRLAANPARSPRCVVARRERQLAQLPDTREPHVPARGRGCGVRCHYTSTTHRRVSLE